MSRDAKVGLVIVFAFVFLLGTIMVHRMNLTGGEAAGGGGDGTGDASGDGDNSSDTTNSAGSLATTAVDAVPAEELDRPVDAQTSGSFAATGRSSLTGTPRPSGPFGTAKTATETAAASDNGGHVAFTDSPDERQPAAVVEPRDTAASAAKKALTHVAGTAAELVTGETDSGDLLDTVKSSARRAAEEIASRRTESRGVLDTVKSARRAAPLLDIGSRLHDSTAADDVATTESNGPAADVTSEAHDLARGAVGSVVEKVAGRHIPALDTPPPTETTDDSDTMKPGRVPIRQTGDNRGPERNDSPPRLPKFGEPAQPTINEVPDRNPFGQPDANDRSATSDKSTSTELDEQPPARTDSQFGGSKTVTPDSTTELVGSPKGRTLPPASTPAEATRSPAENGRTAADRPYTVKENDNFWSISAKQYGSGKYFRALEDYNRDRLQTDAAGNHILKPGATIMLPDVSALRTRPAPKNAIPPSTREAATSSTRSSDSTKSARTPLGSPPSDGPPAGTYRVEEGDTLSTIAQRKLGSAKRWDEIYRLNKERIVDPNHLKLGTELKLPATAEKFGERTGPGR